MFRRADDDPGEPFAGVGSVLLVPEVLSKPLRDEAQGELEALTDLLGRLQLLPVDPVTAEIASALASRYRLPRPMPFTWPLLSRPVPTDSSPTTRPTSSTPSPRSPSPTHRTSHEPHRQPDP
ncbi:MAG: hypothetical protein M5U19_07625 [Microthrixaceae bacterium]|nr:hypothetical protein [Microthrixaceae bacterium]